MWVPFKGTGLPFPLLYSSIFDQIAQKKPLTNKIIAIIILIGIGTNFGKLNNESIYKETKMTMIGKIITT